MWDAWPRAASLAILTGHKNTITALAFSPDGKRAATSSRDHTARLWDGQTGGLLAVLGGHTSIVRHVVFSPDGARVITASEDTTLRLWDARTGDLISVLRGHGGDLSCPPVFAPDGSALISGSGDGTVRVWDVHLLERNGILRGHESFVYDVAFGPDGEQVASSAWDGTTRLWSATTGRQTGLLKHETPIVSSVAIGRDGRQLATVERQRGAILLGLDVPRKGRPHTHQASSPLGWRHAGGHEPCKGTSCLASGCYDGPVRLWEVAGGKEVAQLKGHVRGSIDVAFHPDGTLLASTGEDGTVRLWDVATRAPLAVLRGQHFGQCVAPRCLQAADGKLAGLGFTPALQESIQASGRGSESRANLVRPYRWGAWSTAWPSTRTARGWPPAVAETTRRAASSTSRDQPARRRAARPYRLGLSARGRLEPRWHTARLGVRRFHGARLGRPAARCPRPASVPFLKGRQPCWSIREDSRVWSDR